jgi:formylglycine-generating enzyme required for sulfatase activity
MSPIRSNKTGSLSLNASWESLKIRIPNMLTIPEGEFLMGTSIDDIRTLQLKESDWAYDWHDKDLFTNEQPQHKVLLPKFEISQFPVTNADYMAFVWDTGYHLPREWHSINHTHGREMHPVTGVTRLDAEAFIEWIGSRFSKTFRLPTEAEWEKTARGTDGRIYPWGNMFDPWRCNTSESNKKDTTEAGSYSPGGDSPYGAADMVGNVWEWTSSVLLPYPYVPDGTREEKKPGARYVIRGGAWYYSRKLARCAAREGEFENHQSLSTGFRLARTP